MKWKLLYFNTIINFQRVYSNVIVFIQNTVCIDYECIKKKYFMEVNLFRSSYDFSN